MDWIRLGRSGKDLTGVGGKVFDVSAEELAKHNKKDDAWMAIRGLYNMFICFSVVVVVVMMIMMMIRFPPLPLGGFRQVFKHLANMRLTSFASNI